MKQLLLIQFRARPEMLRCEQEEFTRAAGPSGTFSFISALDSKSWDVPESVLSGFDAVVLGGSGEFDFDGGRSEDDPVRGTSREMLVRVEPLVRYALARNFPMLGVCFGHQIIGELYGGGVRHDVAQKKIGTHPVVLLEDGKRDTLLSGLPQTFEAQYGHKDSLSSLPSGATLLASSPTCNFSVLRYGPKAYTVQFHPELTMEDVFKRLKNSPGYLPEGVDPNTIVRPSLEASSIITRFIDRILT